MNDYFLGILTGLFVYWFFFIFLSAFIEARRRYLAKARVSELTDEECDQIVYNALESAGVIRATIEVNGGNLFMYSIDGKFYCQAPSFEELEKKTKNMYPDLVFHVPEVELEKARKNGVQ